jgi:hypothetical protein
MTKEELIKENATLTEKLVRMKLDEENTRKVLSELLDSYEWIAKGYYNPERDKKVIVRDWIGIAFLIGELKADADYAMCIQAREALRNENEALKEEIYNLKNPPKKTNP